MFAFLPSARRRSALSPPPHRHGCLQSWDNTPEGFGFPWSPPISEDDSRDPLLWHYCAASPTPHPTSPHGSDPHSPLIALNSLDESRGRRGGLTARIPPAVPSRPFPPCCRAWPGHPAALPRPDQKPLGSFRSNPVGWGAPPGPVAHPWPLRDGVRGAQPRLAAVHPSVRRRDMRWRRKAAPAPASFPPALMTTKCPTERRCAGQGEGKSDRSHVVL